MDFNDIIRKLETLSNPKVREGMARYGITPEHTFGVSLPELREIAKAAGQNHELAVRLWERDSRETRILASMIEDPNMVSEEQVEDWVKEFDYWEICDQCCMNLFEKMESAYEKAVQWSRDEREFVKRAGFVLMARLAVSDKKREDREFERFFPLIKREAKDSRNYVKKAVNWALRQIGKRSLNLNSKAIDTAEEIKKMENESARWIASDAIRELTGDAVQKRVRGRV